MLFCPHVTDLMQQEVEEGHDDDGLVAVTNVIVVERVEEEQKSLSRIR